MNSLKGVQPNQKSGACLLYLLLDWVLPGAKLQAEPSQGEDIVLNCQRLKLLSEKHAEWEKNKKKRLLQDGQSGAMYKLQWFK